jgi:uncharacterized protein (DUF362 family)
LRGTLATASAAVVPGIAIPGWGAVSTPGGQGASNRVAVVACTSYGPELGPAFKQCFDLLGGIGALVKNRTVTIKLNLTSTDFSPFRGKSPGETFMTHPATALALTALLCAQGARRVRLVESSNSKASLEQSLALADWDIRAFQALGAVEFENTRNLGLADRYHDCRVPDGGRLFSAFELNHSYADTDVMISLAKLKQHVATGVTLTLKNLFGITPNSRYGSDSGSEQATGGRDPLHEAYLAARRKPPGLKEGVVVRDSNSRVVRTIVDLAAARPVHLAIIDGISTVTGAEGPWCERISPMRVVQPGLLIAGLNPVATDTVGTALMGFDNPRAQRPEPPFNFCENHLLVAEQAGLGSADLARIDWRGVPLAKGRFPFGPGRGTRQ